MAVVILLRLVVKTWIQSTERFPYFLDGCGLVYAFSFFYYYYYYFKKEINFILPLKKKEKKINNAKIFFQNGAILFWIQGVFLTKKKQQFLKNFFWNNWDSCECQEDSFLVVSSFVYINSGGGVPCPA